MPSLRQGDGDGGGAAPDPEVLARQRAELQRLLEDYYKLDYEDDVAGIKTRFRYKEVRGRPVGAGSDIAPAQAQAHAGAAPAARHTHAQQAGCTGHDTAAAGIVRLVGLRRL